MDAKKVYILLDADVVIHFYKADRLSVLQTLYSGRLLILDIVLEELLRSKTIAPYVENFLTYKVIEEFKFPTLNSDVVKEYATLSKTRGKGESACMAVCRFLHHIIASSNLKDIKPYCEQHIIAYLTTMDIFAIAYTRKMMTLAECDACIQQILAKESKLPYNNLSQYLKNDFKAEKCHY
jgi:predicted nucleic acid-binding protein